jgi:hypothetical protein|tara:strand:+ start:399 stop:605 length:207 start_codon:yes stop_codon:yes gene_type:complete
MRKKIIQAATRSLKDSEIVDILTQRNYNYNRGVLGMKHKPKGLEKMYGPKRAKQLEENYQKFKRKEID